MNMRWGFLLSVTLAAAATPTIAPAGSAAQSAASIPDFSGIWGHPYFPSFEPPASGPGPVVNRSRVRQLFGTDGRPLPAANAPLVSNPSQLVGDYTNPILKPQAAEVVRKHGEISLSGVAYPTPSNQCWPGGVPYVFWNHGMQMLQQPHQITILYSNDYAVRRVRMNEPHPPQVTPSWYGDSVGHYEGDTLVIDTVGIKTDRPYAMIDMYGTPYSQALHVVERYRLLDYEAAKEAEERGQRGLSRAGGDPGFVRNPDYRGKGLQLEFTVEDDGVFTKPWSAAVSYRRPSGEWPEMVCAENPHKYNTEKDATTPTADKPDF